MSFFERENGNLKINSLGIQQVTSTLFQLSPRVTEQKFYQIAPGDYMPLMVSAGGAFMDQIGHWRTFSKASSFEENVVQNAANNARLERVDAAYDMVYQKILTYTAAMDYSLIELEQSMKQGTLPSIMEMRLRAAKKTWDLGIQKAAFLGIGSYKGLMNSSEVTNNTADLTKKLSSMTAAELNTFVGVMYERYRSNCNRTAEPACMILPESDHNGLATFTDSSFPIRTKLSVLQEAWATLTGNPGFKILKCAYGDKANFDGTNNRYVIHSNDPESLVMHIPLPWTVTAANSVNSFTWESACYGQFTPVAFLRPAEVLYFSNTAS